MSAVAGSDAGRRLSPRLSGALGAHLVRAGERQPPSEAGR